MIKPLRLKQQLAVFLVPLVVLVLIVVRGAVAESEVVSVAAAQNAVQEDVHEMRGGSDEPLCRFGVNDNTGNYGQFDSRLLRAGWYVDYTARAPIDVPDGVEYVPIINIYESITTASGVEYTMRGAWDRYDPDGTPPLDIIEANIGASWIIGNEPDSIHQNDLRPDRYARAYQYLYNLIKTTDPTAKIFAGGIVQATPLRLQYLDLVLSEYQTQFGVAMPTDGWAIHNFILNEVSCNFDSANCWGADIPPGVDANVGEQITDFTDTLSVETFNQRIVDFRTWMADNGYAGQPLYVSEYGVLFPSDFEGFESDKVAAFMNGTFDFMRTATDATLGNPDDGNLLVQRWSWFSSTSGPQSQGAYLFEQNKTLTAAGQNFVNYTANLQNDIDLRIDTFSANPVWGDSGVDVKIDVQITNYGGSAKPLSGIMVRIYQGDPADGGTLVGEQALSFTLLDATETFSVTLPDLADGGYTFYAEVDVVPVESCLADNNSANSTTLVFERTDVLYLPALFK